MAMNQAMRNTRRPFPFKIIRNSTSGRTKFIQYGHEQTTRSTNPHVYNTGNTNYQKVEWTWETSKYWYNNTSL